MWQVLMHALFQLADDKGLDWDVLEVALKTETKCTLIQRSFGYSWHKILSIDSTLGAAGCIFIA